MPLDWDGGGLAHASSLRGVFWLSESCEKDMILPFPCSMSDSASSRITCYVTPLRPPSAMNSKDLVCFNDTCIDKADHQCET